MPILLSEDNKLNMDKSESTYLTTKQQASTRPHKERHDMDKKDEFCRHPADTESCQKSFLQAWKEGILAEYCIFEGLRSNRQYCRQLLLTGLSRVSLHHKSEGNQTEELSEACKQVILSGYPLEIKALSGVFYEAYYRLIRCIIHRSGFTDDSYPSADDVAQEVLLSLHKHFRKGASVEGSLAAYITRSAVHECIRARKEAGGHSDISLDELQIETSPSVSILSSSVVELWEYLDGELCRLRQDDLIDRTIFAQRSLEICATGQKLSAKQLMADWNRLSGLSESQISDLHRKVVKEHKRFPEVGVIHIAANLINTGQAAPYQLVVVFAAGTGLDLHQTKVLLEQLKNLSANAVYARICRIYSALASLTEQEED